MRRIIAIWMWFTFNYIQIVLFCSMVNCSFTWYFSISSPLAYFQYPMIFFFFFFFFDEPLFCRQITGAMITISKYDDGSEDASKQDRTITIKGNADQVALAQYLINTRYFSHFTLPRGSMEVLFLVQPMAWYALQTVSFKCLKKKSFLKLF